MTTIVIFSIGCIAGCVAVHAIVKAVCRPPHTVESVVREIVEGLDNGTVVLSEDDK